MAAMGVAADWSPRFAASFDEYAVGEVLSAKGAVGGEWSVGAGAVATNVVDSGRHALAIEGEAAFNVTAESSGEIERIDFSTRVEILEIGAPPAPEGRAGFTPARINGEPGYYGWGDGRWNALTAEGAAPAEQTWFEGRIEIKQVNSYSFVSYLVRNAEGEYVRCADVDGRVWFRSVVATSSTPQVAFRGHGLAGALNGEDSGVESKPVFTWCGGSHGDWNDPANWSSNGVVGAGVPAAGSYAFVNTAVTLTNGSENAAVNFLAVEDGTAIIGGDYMTSVELKTSRPRAGKMLEPEYGTFFGCAPKLECQWELADYKGSTFSVRSHEPGYTPTAADYCHWIRFTAFRNGAAQYTKQFYFSKLPVCYMTTDDGKTPSTSKEEHAGKLFVQGNDEFKKQYDGAMTIKVRGNSSKNYPKKPYKIRLEEKTKMFDLADKKNRHWVLLANYNDLSQTRNKLPYDFARAIEGDYPQPMGMRSTWVDCILNGKLLGTYQFSEHIRVAEDRVNIYDWEDHLEEYGITETNLSAIDQLLAADPNSVDITGGYLFEFSTEADEATNFDIASGTLTMHTMMTSPAYLKTSTKMYAWVKNFLKNYFSACTAWDGCSAEGQHWSELCEAGSMVDFFLVNELFDNGDMGQKSRYASVDRGGKLVWGPVWDYDWGSYSITVPDRCEKWRSAGGGVANMNREWTTDPWFCLLAYERYWEVRDRYAAVYAPGGAFDLAHERIAESAAVDEKIWATRKDTAGVARTYALDREILRTFHAKRLAWMDQQFADVATLMASLANDSQTHRYSANPREIACTVEDGKLRFELSLRQARKVKVILNGVVLGTFSVQNGMVAGHLPLAALVKGEKKRNCLAITAYDGGGSVLARNYALFHHYANGTTFIIR